MSLLTLFFLLDRLFGEMCLLDQNAKAAATITAAAERTEIISIPCAKVFECTFLFFFSFLSFPLTFAFFLIEQCLEGGQN